MKTYNAIRADFDSTVTDICATRVTLLQKMMY